MLKTSALTTTEKTALKNAFFHEALKHSPYPCVPSLNITCHAAKILTHALRAALRKSFHATEIRVLHRKRFDAYAFLSGLNTEHGLDVKCTTLRMAAGRCYVSPVILKP